MHPTLWGIAKFIGGVGVLVITLFAALVILVLANSPAGAQAGQAVTWLLQANTNQATWYVTRAAGFTAYLLLWLSTVWGLAVSSRILEGKLHGSYTYDFHQFISLLAIAFLALHIIVLLFDQFLPFSIAQILIPFTSTYRPLWVGLGVLSFYVVLLVTVTFYLRDRIGQKTFRTIHVFSLLSFVGAAAHGLLAGTDGVLPVVRIMYAGTFLSVVFMTVYWTVMLIMKKRRTASRGSTRTASGATPRVVPNTGARGYIGEKAQMQGNPKTNIRS